VGEQQDLLVFDDQVCRPLIDMGALCASAGVMSDWIKIVPVGSWRHPAYGRVDITPDVVREIVANFNAGVLGVDVPVEAPEHQHDGKGAYGWVHELEARADGVWARFNWTEQGYQAFTGAMFKYLSPVLHLARSPWRSPRGEKVANVLVSVSPTNDPFFRYDGSNRLAANLGEFTFSHDAEPDNEGSVDTCKLVDVPDPEPRPEAEAGGRGDEGVVGVDPESKVPVEGTAEAAAPEAQAQAPEAPPLEATIGAVDAEIEAAFRATAAENDALKARLADAEGRVKAVEGQLQAVLTEKRRTEALNEVSGWQFSYDVKDKQGRIMRRVTGVLSPADRELCAEIKLALPDDLAEKFSARMASGGFQPVPVGELGGGIEPDDESVYDEYTPKTVEAAKALRASNPALTPLEAINMALKTRL